MSSNKIQKPKTAKLKKKEDEDEDMNDDNEGSSQNYKPKKRPTLQSKKVITHPHFYQICQLISLEGQR